MCHINIDNYHTKYDNNTMDLSFLIPSKVRRAVLAYWVKNPDAKIHVRGLARELKLSPQQTYKELINMENWGLLFSSANGAQREYRINKRFPFLPMIVEIFKRKEAIDNTEFKIEKTYNLQKQMAKYDKISIPEDLHLQLMNSKRTRPRAYTEEKMMKRKGML